MQLYQAQLTYCSARCAGLSNRSRPSHLLLAMAWPTAQKRGPLKIRSYLQQHPVLRYGSVAALNCLMTEMCVIVNPVSAW